MRTVILDPRPPEIDALIARRRALGLDTYDEVWEGDYHMAAAPRKSHAALQAQILALLYAPARVAGLVGTGPFNLGDGEDSFRVPDFGFHRDARDAVWLPTAAIVGEVLSPHDESWAKVGFYAAHGVDEVVIVDPALRRVTWLLLAGDGYQQAEASRLLGPETADVADRLDWPTVEEVP